MAVFTKLQTVSTIADLRDCSFFDVIHHIKANFNLPDLKQLASKFGLSRHQIRRLAESKSDNYSKAFLALGINEEVVHCLSPRTRKSFLLSCGRAAQLLFQCAEVNECSIEQLTQSQLRNDPVIKTLLPSAILHTTELKSSILGEINYERVSSLPNNFFEKQPEVALDLFTKMKIRLGIDNKWPNTDSLRKDWFGVKLMDKFGNSVSKMCLYFGEKEFETHVAPNNAWDSPEFIRERIVAALQNMGKPITALPELSLKQLDAQLNNGSISSACSRNRNTPFAQLCIELFPEQNFKVFQFIGGVPNFYWRDECGELQCKKAREAIDWLTEQVFGKNSPLSKIQKLSLLGQSDFNRYKLSYLASMPGLTITQVLITAYPELKDSIVSCSRVYDECGKRLYAILSSRFDHNKNPLASALEIPLSKGRSKKWSLRADLLIHFRLLDVFFEIQGAQHCDSQHHFHSNSENTESFIAQVENDRLKFEYHEQNKNIVIYLRPDQLTLSEVLAESERQGLDLTSQRYIPIDKKQRASYLVQNSLLSPLVFD
ncbi:hypothetical protein OCL06_15010 [Alteromonas sp. ASW11-19]|uniref:Helicase XPB/Ssl2 N-terminal domain-containing protein n=1 Tax=Alteromonas salexigens TaxID=2982530 RepID=A0ABT2VTY6_9ALTE|nr:hypothetical protein [Alteromonas salexigens]MCU7555898.1 hypothetical protein [Alteromonas salexigens]